MLSLDVPALLGSVSAVPVEPDTFIWTLEGMWPQEPILKWEGTPQLPGGSGVWGVEVTPQQRPGQA